MCRRNHCSARRVRSPLPVAPRRCPLHRAKRTDRPRTRPRRSATGAGHPRTARMQPAASAPTRGTVHGLRRPPGQRRQRGRGFPMAARSFVACAATWRAVSPPSAARCAMSDSLSRRPPFPQRRHPTATPPARPSDAKQQSRPAPDTGHGPWYSRPTRRQPGRHVAPLPGRASASRLTRAARGPWAAPTLSPDKTVY